MDQLFPQPSPQLFSSVKVGSEIIITTSDYVVGGGYPDMEWKPLSGRLFDRLLLYREVNIFHAGASVFCSGLLARI